MQNRQKQVKKSMQRSMAEAFNAQQKDSFVFLNVHYGQVKTRT